MANKLAVITGSSRGIGLELARQLGEAGGFDIIACCRTTNHGMGAINLGAGGSICEGVEVTSPAGLAGLKALVGDRKIDILVNNAGVLFPDTADNVDQNISNIREQFEVNAMAPLLLTLALRANLGAGSKVAIISSVMGSIADNTSGSYYGYRMSKAAVNMAGMGLHRDLSPAGVSVGVYHPGYVATDMTARTDSPLKITTARSAEGLWKVIGELDASTSGCFRSYNGDALKW
jgi:NAD(P)-dependent dehydrogenase (short-subunit alcohol dehydrogenase family)